MCNCDHSTTTNNLGYTNWCPDDDLMSSELNCLCAGSATHFTPTVQRAPCPTDEHNSSFERQLKNVNAQKLRFACTGIWKNVQDKEGHLKGLRDDTKAGT